MLLHPCPHCKKLCLSEQEWSRHINEQHAETKTAETRHMCTICKRGFSTEASLKRHNKSHMPTAANYKYNCDVRGCTWLGSDNYAAYIAHKATHTGKKPFQCSQCDKSYTSKQSLQGHERTHGQIDRIPCLYAPDCDKTFKENRYLKEHIKTKHNNEAVYCNECGKAFRNRVARNTHYHDTGHK